MPDNKRKLYDVLSKDYDLGTFEQFSNDLNDEEKRKKAYQAVSASYDVGDFDKFSADLGITKAQPVVADQTQTARMDAPDAAPVQKDTVVQPVVQSPVVEDAPEDLNFDDEPQGPAREPEKIRGFFPALGQGAKNMYYGLVNLAGEAAQLFSGSNIFNPLSWGSRNAQEALDELEHRLQAGVDPHTHAEPEYQQMVAALNNPDLTKKQKREAMEQYNKYLEEQWGYHPFTSKGRDRMQHSVDIDLMIEAALKRADGDVEEARRILAGKAGDLSLGDKMSQYAAEGLAQSKETEGFGAWLGQQIPMLLPSAVAIGMSAYTKNPKYAEWIGKGSFGLMAASSAGEAMNQARQYGATDNEVWAAGFTDAAIMYAAGKIPFNRYTGRLFNGAKKQAAAELSAALADESSLAAKEAEELFKKAAKELGGKFNWKEYMADIAAHGATMGSMSALQTMVPMIYEHPEDYPTLWEIVQNGVRGVRDGVFLGSTLGAATQGMKVRNNRARWKEQGGIMFAEMEGEGGEPVMAEVIGMDGKSVYLQYELGPDGKPLRDTKGNPILKNKWKAGDGFIKMNGLDGAEGEATGVPEGTVEILIDGKLESISKEEFRRRVRDVGYKSFGDVEQAEVQMQSDNAYEQGYDVHEPQPRHDAQNMYEYQRKLLKDKTGLDDVNTDDVMFYYESENWTPEQKEAVLDYLKAKSARQGMIDGIRDEIKRKIVAATTAIDNNTSKTDGKIHPATMKDDRRAYIVDGTVVMTEDGTMVDPSKSMHDVLMRDAETGELFFASSDQILSVDDAIDPLAEKQTVAQGIREGIAQDAADQIDGILKFNANDVYTVLTPEGNSFPIQIVPNEQGIIDNGDGTVNVILNPQEGMANAISQMPKDQIQTMVNAYNLQRLDNYITRINELRAKSEAEDLPEAEAPAAPVAQAEGAAPVQAPEAEQPVIPIDDKGRKQYMQAPKEATYQDIYSDEDFETDEEAYGFISGKVKRAQEALSKQQGAVDKIKPENFDSPKEYRAAKDAALEAARPFQETYDYWKSVLDLADADIAAAKAREERAARMEEAALQEPMSLEEVAANGFRGMEHRLDKADFKRETGLSDTELKKFFPFWAKKGQGISVQGLAEAITADDQSGLIPKLGDADQYDTQAVRNAILEVFRTAARPSDIYEYTRNANLWRREEMERAEAEAAEKARLEAEAAAAAQEAEPVVEEPAATEQPETSTAPEVEVPQTPLQQSIAEEAAKVNPEPTDAQKEAGNYQKGHIQIDGYDITIETAKGTVRRGTDADGKPWESEMHQNYGYIRRTEGTDGDHIDVFLSDTPEQGNVFVVDQVDPKTGAFDEHKVMYGFNSMEEAKAAYLSNYEEGWQGLGNITEVSREEFKKWVDSSHRKTKPFAEYKSVKPVEQAPQAETMDPQAIVDVYSQIEATKAEDKGKPGRKEILEALYQANPQLVQFRNEQDQLNAVSDVIALARQYPDLAISKAILEKVAPAEATATEPAAPAEGEQGVINFDNSEAPAATEETAPEVPVPATKEEARAALDKTITTEKGEMMLPEILYVNTAIREMDPTGRELRDAPTTQKSAPGIIPHLKNYIDILAAEYGKKLEQFGSPEGVVKYANDRLAELNKKVKSDEILPADYEAAVQDAVDAVGMLIRKMRYDMPSTAHRADYDYLDTSDFNKAVLQLLSKASPDVLAQLAETKNLPWAASGIIRRAIEREQLLKDVQTYRQMYFEQHPEMPSATPKGKFDIWKFVAKDKQRPAMTGVFHDKGFKVASDTHILVAVKEAYPKENEGRIIDKKKNVITEAKYPKWRDLIQKGEDAGIDIDHLASFIEGVKELTGADFTSKKFYDGVKIALPIGGEMRLFPAEPLATFLRAAKEIGGTITYRNLGESGKSMMLQAEGKGGYALIMNTMPSNWSSPMFHWYATPAELEQMAKKREQDHVVAEATSLVTGKPVEEIEAESRPVQKPRDIQKAWKANEEALRAAETPEEKEQLMQERRDIIQEAVDKFATDKAVIGTRADIAERLRDAGIDEGTIEYIQGELEYAAANEEDIPAFRTEDGSIWMVADHLESLDGARVQYNHERQHNMTEKAGLAEQLTKVEDFDESQIRHAIDVWTNTDEFYHDLETERVADEFISMAMANVAYESTPERLEAELKALGLNDGIITFVKNIDDEQRNDQSLSASRRNPLLRPDTEGTVQQNGRDSSTRPEGNVGQQGDGPQAQSTRGTRNSSQGREVKKSGPNRQIDDFGEHIAGARKDELRNLAKTLEDATEESFVALPLAKAFKRPNTKKLVENGIISEDDAAFVDAVSLLVLTSPKPSKKTATSYRAAQSEREILAWAKDQARRVRVLLDYINADTEGRKAIIDQLAVVPQEVKVAADAYRSQWEGWNKGHKAGDLYPINPILVAAHVIKESGYNPAENGKVIIPTVKCAEHGQYYTLSVGKGHGTIYATSTEEALENAVYMTRLQMGEEDLDHPASIYTTYGIRDTKVGTGRFIASFLKKGRGIGWDQKEFDSKDAAMKFLREKFPEESDEKLNGIIYEPQTWAKPTKFQLVATNLATGEQSTLPTIYTSREEARAAVDANHEQVNAETNAEFKKKLEAAGESSGKQDKLYVSYGYGPNGGSYSICMKDKSFFFGFEILREGFKTSKEAKEYLEAHRSEYEKILEDIVQRRRDFVYFDGSAKPRKGKDYRGGKDADEEMYKVFGFRGVQFGNWTNDADRQAALNNAYDSFMHLAELLGVSPEALSLGGELGLAFGARGSGSAAAHYESDEVVINLTKTQGAGCLAHEWFHALDNYFGRHGGIAHGFATHSKIPGMRPELMKAFHDLTAAMNNSNYGKRSKQKGTYWGSDWEMGARLFEEWLDRRVMRDNETDNFLVRGVTDNKAEAYRKANYDGHKAFHILHNDEANILPYEEYREKPEALAGFPYPTTKEIDETFAPLMQAIFDTLQEKTEDGKKVLFSRTYHGTDADFDRFDLNFLGEGEGSYVYGPGVYVSEKEGIAKTYANVTLVRHNPMTDQMEARSLYGVVQEHLNAINRRQEDLQEVLAQYPARIARHEEFAKKFAGTWTGESHEKLAGYYRYMLETGDYKYDPEAERIAANIEWHRGVIDDVYRTVAEKIGKTRHLYTVDIPDDTGSNYLTFNEEVTAEVSERVKAALRAKLLEDGTYNEKNARELDEDLSMAFDTPMTGETLLGTVTDFLGNDGVGRKATAFLHNLGIVGMSVPTNNNNPIGDHTSRNYVIFNERDARIVNHVRFSRIKAKDETKEAVLAAAKEAMPNTKVVDKHGNPRVVYHGTISRERFNEFNKGDIYMVSKPWHAEQYTHVRGILGVLPDRRGRVMPVFVNLENPLIMDANRRLWRNLVAPWPQDGVVSTEDVANYAREHGYDGVIIKNVRDNMFDDDRTYADDIIAFDSSQVKSAGPTYQKTENWHYPWETYDELVSEVGNTYDDEGNVIPLSERFNAGERDIRFSRRKKADPKKTITVYKLMRRGETLDAVSPLFIDRGSEPLSFGGWYDADSPNVNDLAGLKPGFAYKIDGDGNVVESQPVNRTAKGSITKLPSVSQINAAAEEGSRWITVTTDKKGAVSYHNVGINGAEGPSTYAMRPGWHAGSLPTMRQIGKGAARDIRDDNFVWVEGEIPADVDYQSEADANPNKDIPTHIPTDGYYLKATNADKVKSQADRVGWYVAGAFKPNRLIGDLEARQIIDRWNEAHPDAPVEYDWEREGGRIFNAETGELEPGPSVKFSRANKSQNIFISNAENALENIRMEKATPEQWLKMLEKEGGLKAGEDKWIGLSDFIRESGKRTLTKQEIADFIAEHQIQIEETHYGDYSKEVQDALQVYQDEMDSLREDPDLLYEQADREVEEFYLEMNEKYGENFMQEMTASEEEVESRLLERREMIADPDNDWNDIAFQQMVDKYGDDFASAFSVDKTGHLLIEEDYEGGINGYARHFLGNVGMEGNLINDIRKSYTTEGLENKHEIALTIPTILPYKESDTVHFGDAGEGRAVAWIRFGDATDAEGHKVLFIDEIQSKRHQDARDLGYKDIDRYMKMARANELGRKMYLPEGMPKEEYAEYKALQEELGRVKREYDEVAEEMKAKYGSGVMYNADEWDEVTPEDKARIAAVRGALEAQKKGEAGVEPAPFEKNWHELAFKRMLRYAAEEGYDFVAWTTGEQQNERYNLSEKVDEIRVVDAGMGEHEVRGYKDGSPIVKKHCKGGEKGIAEVIGKDLARKAYATLHEGDDTYLVNGTYASFHGEDLTVGGEGMKGFYDDILPRFANKYGKKWNASSGDILVALSNGVYLDAHAIPVTEPMKESVMRGQVMFSRRKKSTNLTLAQQTQVESDNFKGFFGNWDLAAMETPVIKSKGTFQNFAEAREWAMNNLEGVTETNRFTGEEVHISRNSIDKILSEKAHDKSVSIPAHLAALQSVPEFIRTGIPAEIHADEKGRGFDVLRLYNALDIDGEILRVKSTVRKVKQGDKYYTYEVQEMELLEESRSSRKGEGDNPRNPNTSINSITGAKLLNGVKKNKSSEEILDYSKIIDNEGFPLVVYRGASFDPLAQEPGKGVIKPHRFFTADPDYAARYGLTRAYFLNIRHPFDVRNPEDAAKLQSMMPEGRNIVTGPSGALDWTELSAFDLDEFIEKYPEYDGMIFDEGGDPDGKGGYTLRGVSFMPFNGGAQVKSATDNNGDFGPNNPDVRFSRKTNDGKDKAYREALESGDLATAEALVDEAAREAFPASIVADEHGLVPVFHQTNAKRYVNKETGEDWDTLDWKKQMEWEGRDDWDKHWIAKDFYTFDRRNARTTIEMPAFFFSPKEDPYHEYGDRTIMAYINLTNPAIDPIIENAGIENGAGAKAMQKLIDEGYDGFIRYDEDGDVLEYGVFNSEQIKSAESVVRDDDGNIIPLSQRFDTKKPDIRFSRLARPVDEIVEEGRQRVANENEDARVHLNERMRAIDKNLAKMRMAASAQREYDRETVRSITDLAKELLNNGALSDVTRQEIEKMLTVTRWATGRKDLQGAVDAIMDLMVANQLRHSKGVLDGLLKIRGSKVDARGVEVQGKLDAPGQRTMQVFKDAMDMSLDSIDEHIAAAEERLDSSDDTIKAAAGDELVGLQMARKYVEDIKSSIDEEKGIKNELRQAAEDRRAGKMAPASYREFVESSEEALRQNRMERIEAYNTLVDGLSRMLYESITRGTAFREAEKERVERIHHFANSDLEGSKDDEHGNKNDRFANNGLVRFLLKPLATFDQMLRHFGSKSVNGEGYLWNHFMRGWVDANDAEFKGLQEATKALDAKVSDVFGRKMRWSDLYSVESKMPTVDIKFWDGGKMQDHKLTQGNLLYIYMVNKMSDGRMKLRRMGIEEEHVQAIKAQMDPRFIELADWLQDEFLVGVRNKYNKVYEAMFGASMPAIENYFPLKILANARVREVDMSTPDMDGTTPATITGSIIKRRRNGLALDVMGSDAFSVVIEHLQQMEHWAAFAPFNRDLNTLLSYKKFRNRVQNMSGIYGAGSVIWENFRKSAEIAAGVYRPAVTRDSVDSTAVNIAKGVTAAKISFRVYTAIKQLLSMPAFISDADPALLGKSMATPWVSWNWAMKELPGFEKRWMSKQAGDTRLMKTDSDWKLWRHNLVKTASRLGMSPNAFVDALTISIGAKAMYDTRLKKYLKDGYTREQADKRAKQDATILFNETQQSNENAYLSAMQLDRTWASVALTVFRNSAMGYQRQLVDAVRNLSHKLRPGYKEQAIEFMAKQMVRDGVDEEDAKAAAERNYKKSTFRDAMRVALFGFVMQLAWNLGSYLPYLIAGDDDDDKKKMLQDAARHGILGGLVEGLTGGSVISEAANMLASDEGIQNYSPSLMPVASDIQKVIKLMSYDQVAAANEILNLLVQAGVGVNPQTLTDVGVAIYDACGGDMETTKEATLLIMRTLQVPQSQTDKILMDGIDFTAEKGLDMTIGEFAGRYANYKLLRNVDGLGWLYPEELKEKRIQSYAKRFTKQAEELKRTRGNDLDKAYYEYVDNEYKQVDATLRDLRSGVKAATQSGDQLGAMEYAEMLNNFMATPEFQRYAQAHGQQNAIKRLTSSLKNANAQDRDQIEDMILQLKRQMVSELQMDNK